MSNMLSLSQFSLPLPLQYSVFPNSSPKFHPKSLIGYRSSSPLPLPARLACLPTFDCEVFCKLLLARSRMHPPLTIHRHPMCAEIIEEFQKCHIDHPIGKFFGQCTDLKIKLDKCFRQEKAVKRKANFEESKKLKERLRQQRLENAKKEETTTLPA